MKNYLCSFLEEFAYPEAACTVLLQGFDAITNDSSALEAFTAILDTYKADKLCDFKELIARMRELSARIGLQEYTGNVILLICMSETLKAYYKEAGMDESVWHDSMIDLKYKLDECHCVHGIWGIFVPNWYKGFFRMTLFGFPKLQFEAVPFGRHYEKDGIVLTPDSTVLDTHIPRTGGRLDEAGRIHSYQLGAAFFAKHFGITQPVFVCHSWLLFPRNKEILSPQSNLYAFISDFDIIESGEYDTYKAVWRLFDRHYEGDVDALPQDSSLRRAYADWIRKGEKTGWGYGVNTKFTNPFCHENF